MGVHLPRHRHDARQHPSGHLPLHSARTYEAATRIAWTAGMPEESPLTNETRPRRSLSTKTLRRRIAAGKLRAHRDGPKILWVDPTDVDKLLRPLRTAGL